MSAKEHENIRKNAWSRNDWLLLVFNAAAFLILWAVFNDRLPDPVGSHYNLQGEQDGTMPKWGFWLMNAALLILLPFLLKVTRMIDPKSQNYEKFEGFFELLRWALSLFMLGVVLMMIFQNLGWDVPVIRLLTGWFGVLWLIIGNRLGQVRSNFTFGIRTPWTLTDEHNWKMTHRLAGRLWFVAGLVMLAAAGFTGTYVAAVVLIAAVLVSALIPTLYSYLLYAKRR
ncbi:SdpI family protein [Cohnella caldifontis]|uniref:SdpI family protein n=1 Tax=Cohnella caldifontis TaxID=3027471 RepID=UPI0023EC15CE|nr:SdpI family protein [Cohnella sp. YIM B05605]